eukprot:scaffold217860_cov39-Tisochrysis_lutea.AAC.1
MCVAQRLCPCDWRPGQRPGSGEQRDRGEQDGHEADQRVGAEARSLKPQESVYTFTPIPLTSNVTTLSSQSHGNAERTYSVPTLLLAVKQPF